MMYINKPVIPRQESHSLSPDEGLIVFTVHFSQHHSELFLVHADGSNLRQLTTFGGLNDDPSWAPNRSEIIFVSTHFGSFDICVTDLSGRMLRQITSHERNGGACGMLSLSPDGEYIVYQTNIYAFDKDRWYGDWEICAIKSDGTDLRRLSTGKNYATPHCSPTASQIVCADKNELVLMDLNGALLDRITIKDAERCYRPKWSMRGDHIACPVVWHSEFSKGARNLIQVKDVVEIDSVSTSYRPLSEWRIVASDIAWSSDDHSIVFSSSAYGETDGLYHLRIGEQYVEPIVELAHFCSAPHWSG